MTVLLIWKKRFPKRDRRAVVNSVQLVFPTAKDTGEGIHIRTRKGDTKPVWMFMMFKCFADIQ